MAINKLTHAALSLKSSGENLNHSFIAVTFDSGQFGLLDESTGDFFPKGKTDLAGPRIGATSSIS
jgi:hypothetical protein